MLFDEASLGTLGYRSSTAAAYLLSFRFRFAYYFFLDRDASFFERWLWDDDEGVY